MNLQLTVHDWKEPGTVVWTKDRGHLCPALETPNINEAVIFIDYEKDEDESLIQVDVELAIYALGYPAGPRYLGTNPLDEDANVVSYVGTFLSSELNVHLEKLRKVVPPQTIVVRKGEDKINR